MTKRNSHTQYFLRSRHTYPILTVKKTNS